MRKKQTFLLTILAPETNDASFCGKLKVISSGKTCTFTSLDDLYHLIESETQDEGQAAPRSPENAVSIKSVLDPTGRI